MPAALMTSSSEARPFLRTPLRQSWALSLEKHRSWEIRPFSDWWIFPFFLSFQGSVRRQVDVLYFHHCGKLCHRDSVSVLRVVKRKGAARGFWCAPCRRTGEWQATEACQVRSKGTRRRLHHVSQREEPSPTKESPHFSIVLDSNCVFPSSRQENDRLHTKRLTIAKWPKAQLFFFLLSLSFCRQSPSAKQAAAVLWAQKSRQGLENQERKSGAI